MTAILGALLNEHSDLQQLRTELINVFNKLDAELEPIFNTLQLSKEWKQGLAADAYRAAIDNFYSSYGTELVKLQTLQADVLIAEKDIKRRMDAEIMRGPKF